MESILLDPKRYKGLNNLNTTKASLDESFDNTVRSLSIAFDSQSFLGKAALKIQAVDGSKDEFSVSVPGGRGRITKSFHISESGPFVTLTLWKEHLRAPGDFEYLNVWKLYIPADELPFYKQNGQNISLDIFHGFDAHNNLFKIGFTFVALLLGE